MLSVSEFQHGAVHWWLNHEPSPRVCVILPRSVSSGQPIDGQAEWLRYLAEGGSQVPPLAVLEPLLTTRDGQGAQDRAVTMLHPVCGGFLVGFDVWWKSKTSPSKGYLPLPSPSFFYDCIQLRVRPASRTFYQVLLPNRNCAFYFDIDAHDPKFDMQRFVGALFEEMAAELGNTTTSNQLWLQTLLLDASRNTQGVASKSSCHGICRTLFFDDNHTTMKAFARRVFARLEQRPDHAALRVWHNKSKRWIIPLDLSVYSRYRCFRLYGNLKLVAEPAERRPLVLAPYNRYAATPPDDERQLFLLSVIPQPELRPDDSSTTTAAAAAPSTKRHKPSSKSSSSSSSDLSEFLLGRLQQWGNAEPSVSCIEPARVGTTWPASTLYVSFAGATHAHDHSHQSNNVYAMVEPHSLLVHWHCHAGFGTSKCPPHREPLPIQVAVNLPKQ
jgi:hypothetical protein